ncbi:DUF1641 domain-containing protein [Alicyclobacillus sp. SO9]|uniref:DUF1641 domain-containing protein n=1 Tax=Alicyclobacillus sp. SO9 TaxID=2665646 RepID=UPI0018E7AE0A|nr:DUF1641 domain-containing protein [Alicyclobacillus sp. SO9]QQE81002.1 DUF1641 domain-containing protein [Alicyclobacillus sp. SO9]
MEATERTDQLERLANWQQDGTLENVDKLLHFLNAGLDSMTPEIVDGLVGTVVQLLELGDQLMQSKVFKMAPELIGTLELAVDRLVQWQEDGTLDNLDKLIHFLNAALDSMTPEIVDGLVTTVVQLMELGDQLMQSKLFKMLPDILNITDTMLTDPPKSKHGVRHVVKTFREPEIQDGLQLMLGFLREVGKGLNGKTS